MKNLLLFLIILAMTTLLTTNVYSQAWQQTASTPEGSGVTDMLIRQSNLNIFVTTGSYNWPSGNMGGVRRSTDNGTTWQNLYDAYIGRTIIDGDDGNLYASIWPYPQSEGLYRSTDNGDNWGNPLVTVPSGDNIFSIALNITTTPTTIFAGTRNGPLRSTNNGVTWTPATNGIPANSWVRDVEVDSGGYVVAATTNGLFTSSNNGDVWQQATGIASNDTIVKIMFEYPLATDMAGTGTRMLGGSDDGNLYEAFRGSIYLTASLAAIFSSSETSSLFIAILEGQNRKLHGASTFPKGSFGSGFYTSTDGGTNWEQNNNGLPNNPPISALTGNVVKGGGSSSDVNFYIGFFENMNGGARVFHNTYTVTDVTPVLNQQPDSYQLIQNYPNPFNPSTAIFYSLPVESNVKLTVYNALGKEVSTLVNDKRAVGSYKVEFNAASLPSGIYFYKLHANSFTETKKMILMK